MAEITKIKNILKKYSTKEAYIFGSWLNDSKNSSDIDIAINLSNKSDFFKIYAQLDEHISKPVDLIYLGDDNSFNMLVKRDGLKIYG